ncbi:hypothetical protein B296_00021714 [Ensete ventricosum]|uniref:Uncharacterized protein n=1 Tax=Ensete ventricosum TaxID=4639 RepID=A0A427AXZ3_ENSVE|nr:hypothetical protein B296_00021714 [Ensete ventricosum]
MIPSVRTLTDSKLGVNLYRGSASWNSIGVPSSKVFCTIAERKIDLLMMKEWWQHEFI